MTVYLYDNPRAVEVDSMALMVNGNKIRTLAGTNEEGLLEVRRIAVADKELNRSYDMMATEIQENKRIAKIIYNRIFAMSLWHRLIFLFTGRVP